MLFPRFENCTVRALQLLTQRIDFLATKLEQRDVLSEYPYVVKRLTVIGNRYRFK